MPCNEFARVPWWMLLPVFWPLIAAVVVFWVVVAVFEQ